MIQIKAGDKISEWQEPVLLSDIAVKLQASYVNDIVLCSVNGKLQELHKKLDKDCTIIPVTTKEVPGMDTYKRSAQLLMIKSIYDVGGHQNIDKAMVHFSINKGLYVEVKGKVNVDQGFINQVKARMQELVDKDLPIKKRTVSTDEALAIFHAHGMYDKERLFKYRRVSRVNLYSINEFEDYNYGYMVTRTSYIRYFDLIPYGEGFILQLPKTSNPKVVPQFEPQKKLFLTLKETTDWIQNQHVSTVGELNDAIVNGGLNELILIQEAMMEKQLSRIAEQIAGRPDVKFVMIAGPTSSGKTTFSHRLSIQLKTMGLKPHPIAVDDYFLDREHSPRDEFGNYDFENLRAIDVKQFNTDMTKLLAGEAVELPHYNFKLGKREYKGNIKKLGKNDILVIEGIHSLNDQMSYTLPANNKFKIYISAMTQLNIDEHNRIPSTDGRLIRRIVRDARTRGLSAKDTIHMWPSVKRGEEANIFPYQEEADVIFNSALIYELSALKVWAEPLLFAIDKNDPEHWEAKRLLKFFDYFLPVDSGFIPKNSLVREFIGGSCFEV